MVKRLVNLNVMENYTFIKCIGKGSFGEVWLIKHCQSHKQYILKQINLKHATKKEQCAAYLEAKLLSTLAHPNIVSYFDSFPTQDYCLNIIMGYCEKGDLYKFIRERKGRQLEEVRIVEWFIQICMALKYLHDLNILHRDLKTQNIFLTRSKIIKVGDLGIARVLNGTGDMATTVIGTPYYMSPELFCNKPYNHKSDVWSLGCCVLEMVTLKHAFNAQDLNSLMHKVLGGKIPHMPKIYNSELLDLIHSMLNNDPEKRPSIANILETSYIRDNIQNFLEDTKFRQLQRKQSRRNIHSKVVETSVIPHEGAINKRHNGLYDHDKFVKCKFLEIAEKTIVPTDNSSTISVEDENSSKSKNEICLDETFIITRPNAEETVMKSDSKEESDSHCVSEVSKNNDSIHSVFNLEQNKNLANHTYAKKENHIYAAPHLLHPNKENYSNKINDTTFVIRKGNSLKSDNFKSMVSTNTMVEYAPLLHFPCAKDSTKENATVSPISDLTYLMHKEASSEQLLPSNQCVEQFKEISVNNSDLYSSSFEVSYMASEKLHSDEDMNIPEKIFIEMSSIAVQKNEDCFKNSSDSSSLHLATISPNICDMDDLFIPSLNKLTHNEILSCHDQQMRKKSNSLITYETSFLQVPFNISKLITQTDSEHNLENKSDCEHFIAQGCSDLSQNNNAEIAANIPVEIEMFIGRNKINCMPLAHPKYDETEDFGSAFNHEECYSSLLSEDDNSLALYSDDDILNHLGHSLVLPSKPSDTFPRDKINTMKEIVDNIPEPKKQCIATNVVKNITKVTKPRPLPPLPDVLDHFPDVSHKIPSNQLTSQYSSGLCAAEKQKYANFPDGKKSVMEKCQETENFKTPVNVYKSPEMYHCVKACDLIQCKANLAARQRRRDKLDKQIISTASSHKIPSSASTYLGGQEGATMEDFSSYPQPQSHDLTSELKAKNFDSLLSIFDHQRSGAIEMEDLIEKCDDDDEMAEFIILLNTTLNINSYQEDSGKSSDQNSKEKASNRIDSPECWQSHVVGVS